MRKGKLAWWKWGPSSCNPPFFPPLLMCCFFFARSKSLMHFTERGRGKKGNVKNDREQQGTDLQKCFFFPFFSSFWRVVRPCQAKENRGQEEKKKRAEVSNLFISPKKVTIVYQLTIHFGCSTSVLGLLPLIVSFTLFLSLPSYSRTCFQKRPCQFAVTLVHLFLSFPHFPFRLPAFSFYIKCTWAFFSRTPPTHTHTPSFSLFSLFQTLSHVFFRYCHSILSWHFKSEALCL